MNAISFTLPLFPIFISWSEWNSQCPGVYVCSLIFCWTWNIATFFIKIIISQTDSHWSDLKPYCCKCPLKCTSLVLFNQCHGGAAHTRYFIQCHAYFIFQVANKSECLWMDVPIFWGRSQTTAWPGQEKVHVHCNYN